MNEEELLNWLAAAVVHHLPRADARLVADCCAHNPGRMLAYINVGSGERYTPRNFALFALRCAKRVAAGPAA